MKIHLYDDDARKLSDPNYFYNKGSFAQITDGINEELKKLGLYSEAAEADIVGFASGLKLDFGFQDKRRFCIGVWECNEIPQFLIEERRRLERKGNYQYFGLSQQVQDIWRPLYGPNTPIIDIGCDSEFWKPMPEIKKYDKFTVLSTTALNFRSGIDTLIKAFSFLRLDMKEDVKLIIKNTDDRNVVLPEYIRGLRTKGMDIEYICERQSAQQIRELYNKCHVLAYIPVNTSAGLPVPEASATELPVIVPNYSPTNIYPSCEKVPVIPVSLAECRKRLQFWSLPYTFPEGCVDENKAMMNWMSFTELAKSLLKIKRNYDIYKVMAKEARKEVQEKWTWKHSCDQLLANLNI